MCYHEIVTIAYVFPYISVGMCVCIYAYIRYMYIYIYIYGIFILKVISKYLPVG